MKILIFGGARFIGQYLIASLVEKGHDVTIANRGSIKDSFGDKIKRVIITARNDRECLSEKFGDTEYDWIIDDLAFDSWNVDLLLSTVRCKRYMFISSAGVYYPNKHIDTTEDEFDPLKHELIISSRQDGLDYVSGKKLAEAMAFQRYGHLKPIAVRFPLVIGEADYTGRLKAYVDCVVNGKPMYIDNMDAQISFVSAREAGEFMSFLADSGYCGPINGCSTGTRSLREILSYVEGRCGRKPVLKSDGMPGGYNGEVDHRISNRLAAETGFRFSDELDWMEPVLDHYIDLACTGEKEKDDA